MLFEIELEALRCFTRAELEGLQIRSRYLRNLVNGNAGTLPLRYIHYVETRDGDVYIQLLEDGGVIRVPAPDEQDRETLFRRVNNAFIRRLTLNFLPEDLTLPYSLQENASELQCQLAVLHIKCSEEKEDKDQDGRAAGIDDDLVDFLGVQLKPETYETSTEFVIPTEYALLFTRDALRDKVKHLLYVLCDHAAPDCIIPEFFGADVVETCAITTGEDPRRWIGRFARMFEMAEPGMDVVRSVTLLYKRPLFEVSPLPDAGYPLGRPRRTVTTPPHSAFIKEWSWQRLLDYDNTITESPAAELFVFENARAAKKLEVIVWAIQQQGTWHYAFLLQVDV